MFYHYFMHHKYCVILLTHFCSCFFCGVRKRHFQSSFSRLLTHQPISLSRRSNRPEGWKRMRARSVSSKQHGRHDTSTCKQAMLSQPGRDKWVSSAARCLPWMTSADTDGERHRELPAASSHLQGLAAHSVCFTCPCFRTGDFRNKLMSRFDDYGLRPV